MGKLWRALFFSGIIFSKTFAVMDAFAPIIVLDNWQPYIVGTEGEEPSGGMLLKFNQHILKESGFSNPATITTWEQILMSIADGNADMTIGLKSKDRTEFAVFSIPFANVNRNLYFRKSDSSKFESYEGYQSLAGKKIGIVKGYVYGDLSAHSKSFKFDLVPFVGFSEMQDAVVSGDIDAYIYVDSDELLPGDVVKSTYAVQQLPISYMISKKSVLASKVDDLNQLIAKTLADPSLKELLPEKIRIKSGQ